MYNFWNLYISVLMLFP